MMITQNGEEAMVTLLVAGYARTQETLALLKMFAQSQRAEREGKSISSAEVFKQLRQRRK